MCFFIYDIYNYFDRINCKEEGRGRGRIEKGEIFKRYVLLI